MTKVEKFCLLLVVMILVGLVGRAQEPVPMPLNVVKDGKIVTPVKADEKKLPAEVSIPEVRVDKTKVLVLERALLLGQMEKLEAQYKEAKAALEDKSAKLIAEFASAGKAAGVADADMDKYEFRLDSLKMVLRKEEPATAAKDGGQARPSPKN